MSPSTGGISAASDQQASTAFRLQDFGWSKAPGRGLIRGTIGYRAENVSYTCQGKDVVLLPETAWSRSRVLTLYGSSEAAAVPADVVRSRTVPAPADYALVVKHSTCDAANRFEFQGLPAGRWFLITLASPLSGPAMPVVVMRRVDTRRLTQEVVLGAPL
jgi:hypothetical protein